MKRKLVFLGFLTILTAFVAASGCKSKEPVVPVSGVATFQGEPLVNCVVLFTPTEPANPDLCFTSIGKTDAEGRFQLTTTELRSRPGAVVGKHSVAFRFPQWGTEPDQEGDEPVVDVPVLPPGYTAGTKITFEVPPGGTDSANFDLE